jgi:hypothetical protein
MLPGPIAIPALAYAERTNLREVLAAGITWSLLIDQSHGELKLELVVLQWKKPELSPRGCARAAVRE